MTSVLTPNPTRFTNTANFAALQHWLNNGAVHAAFNLNVAVVTRNSQSFDHYYSDAQIVSEDITPIVGSMNSYEVVGKGECGSVCCIAGAAWQMQQGVFGDLTFTGGNATAFDEMETATWAYLGAVDGATADYYAGGIFPIFDPDGWNYLSANPVAVTGPMAARAMELFNNGKTAAQAIWRALAEQDLEVRADYADVALEAFMDEYVITDHKSYKERTSFDIL